MSVVTEVAKRVLVVPVPEVVLTVPHDVRVAVAPAYRPSKISAAVLPEAKWSKYEVTL
jgi:hypothetical protein